MQRATPPPRGPRAGSSGAGKRIGRGGVQKRNAGSRATRADKDGDLVMDATTTPGARSGKGLLNVQKSSRPGETSRGRTPPGPGRGGNLTSQRHQQAVLRGMNMKSVNVVESKAAALGALRVRGLQNSRAASNSDGGVESLLAFLERKASGFDSKNYKPVRIKKVCFSLWTPYELRLQRWKIPLATTVVHCAIVLVATR